MSRDVNVGDIQEAIHILTTWAESDDCPANYRDLIRALAGVIDHVLCLRDEEDRLDAPKPACGCDVPDGQRCPWHGGP